MTAALGSSQQATLRNHGRKAAYDLSQFSPIDDLGMGAFGVVKKVIKKDTSQIFAMKVMEKKTVVQRGLQEQLNREVLTQTGLRHENIVRLYYHFEDKYRIFCLLEYADKGQLFAYLRDQVGGLPEQRAGLFFWDSLQALHHLHGLNIMHRDIKPENILLFGEDLVAKVGDFGWCTKFGPEHERTTFCGTLDYIPPEMLENEPHNGAVDLWALGVLLYEMLIARAPFAADSQKIACDLICAVKFDIPAGSMSSGAQEIVRGLLVRSQGARLPTGQVLCHAWVMKHGRSIASRSATSTSASLVSNGYPTSASLASNSSNSVYAVDELDATVIIPKIATAPKMPNSTLPSVNEKAVFTSAPAPAQKKVLPDKREHTKTDKTSPIASAISVEGMSIPIEDTDDSDLLTSVPDSKVELDDLEHLWGGFASPSSTTSAYASKQAGKEFNIDDTRRRTAAATPLSSDKLNSPGNDTLDVTTRRSPVEGGNDKVEVTTWRSPVEGGLPRRQAGTKPRPKMRSGRTKEFD